MDIKAVDRHVARHTHSALAACVVNHRHPMTRISLAHAAGLGIPKQRTVPHHIVDLGLSKHFVHDHAQFIACVGEHSVAHGLAGAHDGLELEFEVLARMRISLHHGFECSRKQECVRNALGGHQFKGQLGAEAALVRHDGPAEVQGGQQRVHQPACPGPVGR